MTPRPIVIAHRGASGYRPEHTATAYQLAIDLGADAVEPDLVATKDGILVVRHENEIGRTTDISSHPEFASRRTTKIVDGAKQAGWFTEDFTWAELSTLRSVERIPKVRAANTAWDGVGGILRFSDLLSIVDSAPRQLGLVAEIKHATYFAGIGLPLDELVAGELVAAGWQNDRRLTIESFEKSVLAKVRHRGIRAHYVFLLDAKGSPPDEVALKGAAAAGYTHYLTADALTELVAEVDGISVHTRLIRRRGASPKSRVVDDAHAAGLTVYCWTLRAENKFLPRGLTVGSDAAALGDWKRDFFAIMQTGVDGVFADQPDLAIDARAVLID